jgi:hypothetical protein
MDVKGGEGNSINISDRPLWAREFSVWCHLDGAIVNDPAHGVHAIISRLTTEMAARRKLVDVAFVKDVLCGTRTRPCPKYPANPEKVGLLAAPDIFLFPQAIPTPDHPDPPVHTLTTLQLPRLVLDLFEVQPEDRYNHIWEVHVSVKAVSTSEYVKEVEIWHKGIMIDHSKSRPQLHR